MKAVAKLWFVILALVANGAMAQDAKESTNASPPSSSNASFEVLDAKMCSGVNNKEPVDAKASFNVGEKAWIWLKVKPVGETSLQIRWYANDKEVFAMAPVAARLGRLWFFKTVDQPGEWRADVLDSAQQVIRSEKFSVTGEAMSKEPAKVPETTKIDETSTVAGSAKTTETAKTEQPAKVVMEGTTTTGGAVEVLEFKLAEKIENREPVGEATNFGKGAKVYTWMKLKVNEAESNVKLRWSVDEKEVSVSNPIPLKKSSSWKTWLYKTVHQTGNWKVEVLSQDNQPLHTVSFVVQ